MHRQIRGRGCTERLTKKMQRNRQANAETGRLIQRDGQADAEAASRGQQKRSQLGLAGFRRRAQGCTNDVRGCFRSVLWAAVQAGRQAGRACSKGPLLWGLATLAH